MLVTYFNSAIYFSSVERFIQKSHYSSYYKSFIELVQF